MQNMQSDVNDEYDKEFVLLTMGIIHINKNFNLEIEKRYDKITKHNRLKIESWVFKF
jgi:hypothetical protein